MNILDKFKNTSLKIHLIVGITLIHGLLISLYTYDLTLKQKESINQNSNDKVASIANTFSASNITTVLVRDYAGLNEAINNLKHFSELTYTFVYLPNGKILSHSNNNLVGKYLSDKDSLMTLNSSIKTTHTVINNDIFIDVASPIIYKKEIIAWVRVGFDKSNSNEIIHKIIIKGCIYTFISLILGFIFSYWIANLITHQLNHLISLAKKVEEGDLNVRSSLQSKNEVGQLSNVLNSMIDRLKNEKEELVISRELLLKSEERFELAMKGSKDAVWDYNVTTGEVYFSPRWIEMLGISPDNILPSVDEWVKRVHPDDIERAQKELTNHALGLTTHYECEHRLMHSDGYYIWTIGRGIGVKDSNNLISRIVGTQSDISIQKKAEEEKDKIYDQLRQSQKMEAIGHLTGGIAHDFNNILTGIIGFTDLSQKRPNQDEKTIGYLYQVSKLALRARDLIRQMLIFSRGGDPEPRIISAKEIILESIHLIEPIVTKDFKMNTIFNHFNPSIKIDPIQLQQIIMNLAINARDAMVGSHGEINIHLNNKNCSDENIEESCSSCGHKIQGQWVQISIADNGTGISDDTIKKIFEPFFSTKPPSKGTGMGLSMVHGILHRHHGHIVVKSEKGVGTEFKLFLPESQPEDVTQIIPFEIKTLKPLNKKRILVVDDEDFIRGFVTEFLLDVGYECVEAVNGLEALNIMNQDQIGFDLVITDYTMPEMTGIELIENIRKNWPNQPIILSSGNIDIALEREYKHLKIDAIMVKPYEIDDALEIVDNLLRAYSKSLVA
jgi:PAS domain S-box-containing protein